MSYHLERSRRRVGFGMIAAFLLFVLWWYWWPGLPVLWAPSASAAAKAGGEMLFEHEWTANDPLAHGDGLGPVFNASSCVACHFQGGVGGGGPNQNNVVAFEVAATKNQPEIRNGLIHHFAVGDELQESAEKLRLLFPAPLRTESINSTALFGIGWIDRISEQSITSNRNRKAVEKVGREIKLEFNSIAPGRLRVLANGRVGKFGWRGQFATLKEFTAAACANEAGARQSAHAAAQTAGPVRLSREQARPGRQAIRRSGCLHRHVAPSGRSVARGSRPAKVCRARQGALPHHWLRDLSRPRPGRRSRHLYRLPPL